jgi:hypothetical protein
MRILVVGLFGPSFYAKFLALDVTSVRLLLRGGLSLVTQLAVPSCIDIEYYVECVKHFHKHIFTSKPVVLMLFLNFGGKERQSSRASRCSF